MASFTPAPSSGADIGSSPHVTHAPMLYHDVSSARIEAFTAAGLQAAGIPLAALGERRDGKQVLTSCFQLSIFAREGLPIPAGGAGIMAAALSASTTDFMEKANTVSPTHTRKAMEMIAAHQTPARPSAGGGGGSGGASLRDKKEKEKKEKKDSKADSEEAKVNLSFDNEADDGPSYPSPTHSRPKDQQVHIQAARDNEIARAHAFGILSQAETRFALIGAALRKCCGAAAPANIADFTPVALGEAATAFQHQISGLAILRVSAQAYTGGRHGLIAAILSDRFDEKAADVIADKKVVIEINPIEIAMGCYPVLQLALHLYYKFHSPVRTSISTIVAAAQATRLGSGSDFSPARGLDAFHSRRARHSAA